MNYTQCLLQSKNKYTIAWIATKHAVIGNKFFIENTSWEVKQTYSTNTQEHIFLHEMDYKKQRRASDI